MSRREVARIVAPAVAIPLLVFLIYALVPAVREHPWTATRIAGVFVSVAGYFLVCIARIQLGESFTVGPQARKLVTGGLYSRIRHPIYVFVDLMVAGLILVFTIPWLFAVLAIVIVGQTLEARREARVLEQKFGPQYRDYVRQTWF